MRSYEELVGYIRIRYITFVMYIYIYSGILLFVCELLIYIQVCIRMRVSKNVYTSRFKIMKHLFPSFNIIISHTISDFNPW